MNIPISVFAAKTRRTKKFHWRGGAAARCLAGIALAGAVASSAAHAASATFNPAPTSNSFGDGGNWSTGAAPGATTGITNTDTATFSAALTNAFGTATSPLLIDLNRNLQNITFSGATASAYVIGTTSGNALLLTNGGTIQTTATVTNTQTVNAPFVIEPASATTAGTYTLSSNAAAAANILNIGGPITLGATTAADTLNFAGTNTGANTFSGTVSDTGTGGLVLNKSGAGSWTFGGNGTSTLAKGNITINGGTLNFGSATDTPTLNINGSAGSGVGVFVISGNFNMNAGALAVTSGQGLVLNGNNTYTQTGGTFTTNGRIEFANGGGASVVNVSAGSLTTTASSGFETVRGTSTITLSGTGAITTPVLDMTTTQLSGGAAGSTFNLNGGTLNTGQIIPGSNGTTGIGTIFNFNGGILQASASSATFMQGLTADNVLAGGAIINTGTNNDTIGQNLLTDGVSTGGGLTKQGAGILTLTGANTYTGATQIANGTLAINSDGNLGAVPSSAVSNIQFTGTAGTLQDTTNNVTLNANRSITIANGATATLDSGANVFQVGGAVSTGGGAVATTLALTGTSTGANTLSGTVSDAGSTGGLIISKTGTGTWTLGGNGTSTLAKGNVFVTGGTLNFGVTGADSPTLALAFPNQTAVSVTGAGSIFNMANGSLTLTDTTYGLLFSGNGGQTFNQIGGSISTNGLIGFSDSGGSTTVNITGGTLTTTRSFDANGFTLATRGNTTLTLSGTGVITAPTTNMSTNQIGSGAATSTFNLNSGGTLVTGTVIKGTGGSTGTQTFNFNGGTVQSSASTVTFMQGLTTANVQAGGAFINTNGKTDTIGQNLLASTTSTGGGLTKLGAGTLTLTGTNTYTGVTTITAGGLTAGKDGSLGTGNVSVGSNGILTLTGGTTNDYIGNTSSLILTSASNATPFVFLTFTGTDLIGNLSFDGGTTFAQAGTYGAVGSGALFTSSDFSGTGILTNAGLAAAPEPSQYAAFAIGLLGLGALALKARKRSLVA